MAWTRKELRAELKRRGWTQTALAKRLGVDVVMINRWCQGTRPVPPAVAAYLRVEPEGAVAAQLQLSAARAAQRDSWPGAS